MAEFTPGPWKRKKGTIVHDTWNIYTPYTSIIHAQVMNADKEMNEANARLMAAAPDGYACIKAFVAAWDSHAIALWDERDVKHFRDYLALVDGDSQ